jgi:hypothetical protein
VSEPRRLRRRVATTLLLGTVFTVIMAVPAFADPAGPTNYRSVVTSVDPDPTGVTIEVIGGDAFLSVAIAEGHTLLVEGYFGEPYLRIDPDGSVWLNTLSPARYINQDRYGRSGVPDFADANANPEWEQVGDGGSFAWHDHRIHWMSFDLPPVIVGDRAQSVFPWTLTMYVDGVETEISGELLWFPGVNPFGPLLIGLVALLPLVRHHRRVITVPAMSGAGFGALALFTAVAQYGATPGFDRAFPVTPLIPAIGVIAGVGALWVRSNAIRSWALAVISGIALVWWAVSTGSALDAPVLASALPTSFERLAVSLSLWAGLSVVAVSGFELFGVVRRDEATAPTPSSA